MADIFKSKTNEFYIDLKQERYFFPGENVSGDVVLLLDKQTKTNNIKVLLEGNVDLGGRTIKFLTKFVLIAQPPEGEKNYLLDPHTHRFPFTITIPTIEECNIPSTLEINKLVKVYYRLTAIFNKVTFFNSLNASTSLDINVLENINVKSLQYSQDLKVEKELMLEGAYKPVRVSTTIGKRAAVKGDTIPISIKIEHIGVMVRDRAISVQLLRSVYYGKNQTELFGPKEIQKVTSNIEISGPTSFTKTFRLSMPIPKDTCPTVDKSGQTFRIEYTIHVSVNLNEESPYRPESPKEFVLFNFPFVIGTCPRLTFNIDDDDDQEDNVAVKEETESIHSSEYDQVTETMKHLDLGVLQAEPVEMVQQEEPPVETVQPPVQVIHQQQEPTTPLPQRYSPPKPHYEMPTVSTSTTTEGSAYKPDSRSPIHQDHDKDPSIEALLNEESEPLTTATNSGGSTPQIIKSSSPSPQLPYTTPFIPLSPAQVFNDYTPATTTTTTTTTTLGRKESAHWVVRNQENNTPVVRPSNSSDVRNSPLPDFAGMPVPQPNYTQSTPTTTYSPPPPQNYYPPPQNHYPQQQQSNYYNPNLYFPQPQHDYRPPQPSNGMPYTMPLAVFQPSFNMPSQQHGYPTQQQQNYGYTNYNPHH
ncbi:hypothetical protein BD770DRAFT_444760 [Pilaira anomala]|nr:hypothetical protein BD770DRAFT_444760 [Pilaira anomala]